MILQAEIHASKIFVITVNTTAADGPSKFKPNTVFLGENLSKMTLGLKETKEVGEKRASLFRSMSFVICVDHTCWFKLKLIIYV